MSKKILTRQLASITGMSIKEANTAIDGFTEAVVSSLAKGEEISLPGFGSFKIKHRKARKGINPLTGKKLNIKAKDVPKFTASKKFKEAVM